MGSSLPTTLLLSLALAVFMFSNRIQASRLVPHTHHDHNHKHNQTHNSNHNRNHNRTHNHHPSPSHSTTITRPPPPPSGRTPPRTHNPPPPPSPSTTITRPPPSSRSPPVGAGGNSRVYDVRRMGAVGDGKTDDTGVFMRAWEAACSQGNSRVLLVPSGYSFLLQPTTFSGPCQPGLLFQVDGGLTAPDGPGSWPEKESNQQWLSFHKVDDMLLAGGSSGLIDGRGQRWWDLPCKPHHGPHGSTRSGHCDSPNAIRFYQCDNVRVEGVVVRNSPRFHIKFDECQNVHVDSVRITSPASSPNTDGIHVSQSTNVQIYNSFISNGDDCISIGSGSFGLDIWNMTCVSGHGISIGSLGKDNSQACVGNITARDSVIRESQNGVRIKTWQGGRGAVSGVEFRNINMDNVRNPIIIDQFYCDQSQEQHCSSHTSAVYVSGVAYRNIKGTYNPQTPPLHLACSHSVPCTNITLSHVSLAPATHSHSHSSSSHPYCSNAYGHFDSTTIATCLLQGHPTSSSLSNVGRCST